MMPASIVALEDEVDEEPLEPELAVLYPRRFVYACSGMPWGYD